MRGRVVTLLVLLLGACRNAEAPAIGVVVSGKPSQAARLGVGTDSAIELFVRPNPEPVDAEAAISIATAFVAEPSIIAVIGHSNSAASLAASRIYNDARVVQIAPTSTAPIYDQAGPYSYRMVPSDSQQAVFLASTLKRGWPDARRVAIVHVNDDYGRGLYRQARPHIGEVVYDGLYADVADSANILLLNDQISAVRPDVLLWLGRPRRLRQILQPLLRAAPGMTVLCSDACDEATVHENADGDYDGLVFVRFTDPDSPDAAMRSFQAAYQALAGEPATSEALLTYDAAGVLAAAVRAGARSGDDVRRYLDSLGRSEPAFQGLTGPLSFDSAGSAMRQYLLAQVRGPADVTPYDWGRR